jgi:crotonobetainyl-CoA:carnitine CoA-transferase CaiB-like acyl-CoA transferase
MKLGDVSNADAAGFGKPLDGVRVLAVEQMQALPYATQLLARLGAEVVKVEHPSEGESGRGSQPGMRDPDGRWIGATFLRNNLGKRSVGIDLKTPEGRDLLLRLVPRFDVLCENFKSGTMDRLGLGYDAVAERHPGLVYLSISGFGNTVETEYSGWPAYASIVEGMSGIYAYKTHPGERPRANPVGALGDISSALFGVVGILAALRHRERTGLGQYVDVAMLDAVVSMTDIVTNFWSLGVEREEHPLPMILDTFRTSDGWFVMQLVRDHQFLAFADVIGHPEWKDDPRFETRTGWGEHLDTVIRPAVEHWAAALTKREAAAALMDAGVAAGPCLEAGEVVHDPLVNARDMLVEMPRTDGVAQPVLIPGNPVKMSRVAVGPESRVPWVGEHTDAVLRDELALDDSELDALRAAGAITVVP